MEGITTAEDYAEYSLGIFNDLSEGEDVDEEYENVVLSVIIPLCEYLPFIYACSKKLAYSRGRTLSGATLKKIFNGMGLSLESKGKDSD